MRAIEEYSEEKPLLQSVDYSESGNESDNNDKSIAKGGVTTPFPWKLHDMLDDMARKEEHDVVTWQPHGRAFMVHKPKEFTNDIMPHYFNQTKYASFQRQLNLYGFSRLCHGRDKGAYYHMCFVRGERNLCRHMVRQKIKGTKVRRSLSPEEEPNFYLPRWASTRGVVVDGVTVTPQQVKSVASVVSLSSIPSANSSPTTEKKTKPIFSKAATPQSTPVPSLVSMMRNDSKYECNQQTTIPPPPIRKSLGTPLSQEPQGPLEMPLAGDLLFFEGRPFRYLEHLEELPPVPALPQAYQETQFQQTASYKDRLHHMINSIVTDTTTWNDSNQFHMCSV
jgi:hypothetical protein